MIRIHQLVKAFKNHLVLDQIDAEIPLAGITGLIGPSAGGKSVLLKILGGVINSDSGTIDSAGIELVDTALMFQEGALFDSLSLFDNVAFPLVDGRVPSSGLGTEERESVRDRVSWILARVGLSAAAQKMPAQLSGGMRRRASLARALVERPKLVLLDDPTAGLDPVASTVIMELILELQKETGTTILVVSHDLRRLLPICQKVLCLFNGKIVYSGVVSELISAPDYVKKFISCRYELQSEDRELNKLQQRS